MANTHTDEIFNVYGALTKRIAELEELITQPKLKR